MKDKYISWLGRGAVLFDPEEREALRQSDQANAEAYARGLQEEEALQHYFPCTADSGTRNIN